MDIALVPIGPEHVDAMYRWMLDDEVRANVGVRAVPSRTATETWVLRAMSDASTEARGILLEGQHVGNVVLDQIDRHIRRARLSIYVGDPTARGRGVGGEAVTQALGVAFRELSLAKVVLTVHVRNAAALALYARAGFVVEGVHREEFLLHGEWIDVVYMGILRSEYERVSGRR